MPESLPDRSSLGVSAGGSALRQRDRDETAEVLTNLRAERDRLRAENEALKERAENSEQALRKFQAGLTDTLRVYNVPAMPSWSEALHWLAKNGSRASDEQEASDA